LLICQNPQYWKSPFNVPTHSLVVQPLIFWNSSLMLCKTQSLSVAARLLVRCLLRHARSLGQKLISREKKRRTAAAQSPENCLSPGR
jgi:hypothetical protein